MARRVRTLAGTGSDSPALVALLESLIDRHAPPTRGTVALAGCARSARPAPCHQWPDDAARPLGGTPCRGGRRRRRAGAPPGGARSRVPARRLGRGRRGRVQRRVRARTTCGRLAARVAPAGARGSRGQRSPCVGPVGCPRRAGRSPCVPRGLREPPRRRADEPRTGTSTRTRSSRRHVPMPRPRVPSWLAPRRPASGRCACMQPGPLARRFKADVLEALAADTNVNVRHAALAGLAGSEAAEPDGGRPRRPRKRRWATRDRGGNGAARAPAADREVVDRAPRRPSRRLTAPRATRRGIPRVALIERIDELDVERATTLRPYLSDFDPFVAERVAALLRARGVAGCDRRPEGRRLRWRQRRSGPALRAPARPIAGRVRHSRGRADVGRCRATAGRRSRFDCAAVAR